MPRASRSWDKRRRGGGVLRHLRPDAGRGLEIHKIQPAGGQTAPRYFPHRVLHHPAAGEPLHPAVELDKQVIPVQIAVDGGLRPVHKGHHVPVLNEGLEQGLKLPLPTEEGGGQQQASRHRQQGRPRRSWYCVASRFCLLKS